MAKISNFPPLYDEVLKLNITKINRWGYLKPNHHIKVNFFWGSEQDKRGEISAWINTIGNPYIILDYQYRGNPRNYKLYLTSTPSNLGKGEVWYFICPHTGKRCRNLYSINGYFLHREAHKGCFYEKQTYSKKRRQADELLSFVFGRGKAYEKIYSKNFKRYYAGKPTRKYIKLLRQAKKADTVSKMTMDEIRKIIF